ncbi:MAG: hypothetical protein LBG15_03225 [Dysgonamonadaceae bacterium]|jgi:hypothetical protein|nr:hypothetical protein [Dysgonamonadaceae bacterium]
MNGFITSNCNSTVYAHTKTGDCAQFEGKPLGLIFTDQGASFPVDENAFKQAISEGIYALQRKRVVPLMKGIVAVAPNGGDISTSQEGFGPETPIGINAYREDYTITSGGICLYKQLAKMNGKTIRFFKVDQNNVAYGTYSDGDDSPVFRGYLATFYVTNRANSGDTGGAVLLSLFYSLNYEQERINTHALPVATGLEGLSGVVLQKAAANTAKVILACSGEDITSVYGEDLAVASLFVSEAGTNPTAVSYANGVLSFTAAGSPKFKIADAAVLHAAGIDGIEGESEYVSLS